jgi:hypothetical protein
MKKRSKKRTKAITKDDKKQIKPKTKIDKDDSNSDFDDNNKLNQK